MSQRKPSTTDAEYLAYVRAQPCCGCGVWGQQHAHHPIGQRFSSAKVSDVLAFPLCQPCHAELHADWPAWEAAHGSQWMHAARTLDQARRDGVINVDKKCARALA
jgi:hypothetical protein